MSYILRRRLLQLCSSADWHFFLTLSKLAVLPQNSGKRSSMSCLSQWSSRTGRPLSFPAPRGVHLFIISTPNTHSLASCDASFPALVMVLCWWWRRTCSTGRKIDLFISLEGRELVGFIPSIGSAVGGWQTSCCGGVSVGASVLSGVSSALLLSGVSFSEPVGYFGSLAVGL